MRRSPAFSTVISGSRHDTLDDILHGRPSRFSDSTPTFCPFPILLMYAIPMMDGVQSPPSLAG